MAGKVRTSGEPLKGAREEIWLLGQPPLQDYLDFVADMVIGGDGIDRRTLCDEWRIANDHYYELEQREAGIADEAGYEPIDETEPVYAPLIEEVLRDEAFRQTYDTVPVKIAMVELDKLIVSQPHITAHFARDLTEKLGARPDPRSLFRVCLPAGGKPAPFSVQRLGSKRFIFTSESTDLRFHEGMLAGPGQLEAYSSHGPIAGVVGLIVGFSSNYLSVIRSDDRMLLHNGYHRAYALRAAGITHAPCVVQMVTRRDELAITAPDSVNDDPAFFFRSKRPPLLKDFFDPKLRKVLPARPYRKMIEVSFQTREVHLLD